MEKIRKPYQGVHNILRFNWHFYLLSFGVVLLLFWPVYFLDNQFRLFAGIFFVFVLAATIISLFISFYVYDVSDLYTFSWLDELTPEAAIQVVNIHAGFDEISALLQKKYNNATLTVLDFYNPLAHTEISIKRARKAYPSYPNTQPVTTAVLPLSNNSADRIFAFLAAHEIRNKQERIIFFRELNRILSVSGQIIVTEHLRDTPNLLAYNIGYFHFYSKNTWLHTFDSAGLQLEREIKITPFISTFILKKNDCTS